MFGNCLIEMAARAAGFTPAQLAVIEQKMPATRKLIDLIIKAQPLIQKFAPIVDRAAPLVREAQPIVTEAMPLIQQATPLIDQISREVQVIAPAIQIVMDVLQRDMAQGRSLEQSFGNALRKVRGALGGSQTW
jgi:hypothetical protein